MFRDNSRAWEYLQETLRNIIQSIERIEVREQDLITIQTDAPSGDYTLTTSMADVPGCTLSIEPGIYLVTGVFDTLTSNDDLDNGQQMNGTISVAGVDEAKLAVAPLNRIGTSRLRMTAKQDWRVEVTVTTTINLRARKTGGTGSSQVMSANTLLTATRNAIIG